MSKQPKEHPHIRIPLAIFYHPTLTKAEKDLYGALLRHSGKKQSCFPSRKILCNSLCLKPKTVTEGLATLRRLRLIKIIPRKGHSSIYTIVNIEEEGVFFEDYLDAVCKGGFDGSSWAGKTSMWDIEETTRKGGIKEKRDKKRVEKKRNQAKAKGLMESIFGDNEYGSGLPG